MGKANGEWQWGKGKVRWLKTRVLKRRRMGLRQWFGAFSCQSKRPTNTYTPILVQGQGGVVRGTVRDKSEEVAGKGISDGKLVGHMRL